MSNPRDQIRDFVIANMSALTEGTLQDSDNIFELGFVSSMFAMQLLEYLETTFDITIPDEDITLANFSSVHRMTAMVQEYHGVGAR